MDEDETTQSRGETVRQGIGQAGMHVMDVMDDDMAICMETFCEHVCLMQREFHARGIERSHAAQIITSFTVGTLFANA